jgi:hypothetical protein
VRVLIASPGDTVTERKLVREALEDWNSLHAENHGVMVLPLMWERDATPDMRDRPQGVINRQLVDSADMLIGIFWTRLGASQRAYAARVPQRRCARGTPPPAENTSASRR